jgi:hypothetical protein
MTGSPPSDPLCISQIQDRVQSRESQRSPQVHRLLRTRTAKKQSCRVSCQPWNPSASTIRDVAALKRCWTTVWSLGDWYQRFAWSMEGNSTTTVRVAGHGPSSTSTLSAATRTRPSIRCKCVPDSSKVLFVLGIVVDSNLTDDICRHKTTPAQYLPSNYLLRSFWSIGSARRTAIALGLPVDAETLEDAVLQRSRSDAIAGTGSAPGAVNGHIIHRAVNTYRLLIVDEIAVCQ